jgi:hypothetical protein
MKTTTSARIAPNRFLLVAATCTLALSACGGGGHSSSTPQSTTYDLQAGYGNLITTGLTTPVALSGTEIVNGTPVTFTGSGTLAYAAATSTTFDNSPALSQVESITATVTVAGQSQPISTSVTDYFAPSTYAFLGEFANNEYDVAQSPITYPNSVVGGSNGTLGTINRYTDNTMSVTLGTAQLSYTVSAPVDSGSPVSVAITNKIYDTTNTLVETDVTTFTLSTSNVLAFVSATAQTSSNTLLISAQ